MQSFSSHTKPQTVITLSSGKGIFTPFLCAKWHKKTPAFKGWRMKSPNIDLRQLIHFLSSVCSYKPTHRMVFPTLNNLSTVLSMPRVNKPTETLWCKENLYIPSPPRAWTLVIPAGDQPEATIYALFPIQSSSSTQSPWGPEASRKAVSVRIWPQTRSYRTRKHLCNTLESDTKHHRTQHLRNIVSATHSGHGSELQQLQFEFQWDEIQKEL